MYTSLPPGRSTEYATMKLNFCDGDLYAHEPQVKNSNWLLIANDKVNGLLYIGFHKTCRSFGVQKIELSTENVTSTLLQHLVEYSCKHRLILVTNKTHEFLFMVSGTNPCMYTCT